MRSCRWARCGWTASGGGWCALVNRFRWEDREAAKRAGRAYERVRSLLTVEDVLAAQAQGVDLAAKDTVLSILSLEFVAGAGWHGPAGADPCRGWRGGAGGRGAGSAAGRCDQALLRALAPRTGSRSLRKLSAFGAIARFLDALPWRSSRRLLPSIAAGIGVGCLRREYFGQDEMHDGCSGLHLGKKYSGGSAKRGAAPPFCRAGFTACRWRRYLGRSIYGGR